MIVPPGRSLPVRSASSIMVRPILSLTLPPGLSSSSLARTVGLIPAVTFWRRTIGVFPTRSRIELENFNAPSAAIVESRPYPPVFLLLGAKPAKEDDGSGHPESDLAEYHQDRPRDGLVDERREPLEQARGLRIVGVEGHAREHQGERNPVLGQGRDQHVHELGAGRHPP